MLTLLFGNLERNWLNPNRNPDSRISTSGEQEVKLKANRKGHYVVTGTINDTPVNFLLDTGATDVALSDKLARRLGLERGARGTAYTANGAVTVYATRINRLQIGSIILYDVAASINPAMDNFILLGMSALKRVEFSQKNGTLTLKYNPED